MPALRGETRFVFRVAVLVKRAAVRECQDQDDRRPAASVVADEIKSNLESVPYVNAVSVDHIDSERGGLV